MTTNERVKFTILSRNGIPHNLFVEIDYTGNSISVPYAGALIGEENITTFMDAIQRAAALLALSQEAKENDD